MPKYKIGATEGNDAGLCFDWAEPVRTGQVDGAVLTTKSVNPKFINAVCQPDIMPHVIVHATCTGYGRTPIELHVMPWQDCLAGVLDLVTAGFPKEKIVIRVDPIIPNMQGCLLAQKVICEFMHSGFARYRISIIDMYPHARARFTGANIALPYGERRFAPGVHDKARVDDMLRVCQTEWQRLGKDPAELRIEACAEPGLLVPIQCGCISAHDLTLLGLDASHTDAGCQQRPTCMCYSGKTELLKHGSACAHKCLYCYWSNFNHPAASYAHGATT